jgi:hypothetical protein
MRVSIVVYTTKYYYYDTIKEDEMGRACSARGGMGIGNRTVVI